MINHKFLYNQFYCSDRSRIKYQLKKGPTPNQISIGPEFTNLLQSFI